MAEGRPPPPARLPSGASFGERGDPRPSLRSTASTFSERDLTDVDTPPPPPPQFLASVEAAAKTAPGGDLIFTVETLNEGVRVRRPPFDLRGGRNSS